jgi:hypothetical protein
LTIFCDVVSYKTNSKIKGFFEEGQNVSCRVVRLLLIYTHHLSCHILYRGANVAQIVGMTKEDRCLYFHGRPGK